MLLSVRLVLSSSCFSHVAGCLQDLDVNNCHRGASDSIVPEDVHIISSLLPQLRSLKLAGCLEFVAERCVGKAEDPLRYTFGTHPSPLCLLHPPTLHMVLHILSHHMELYE